MQVSVDPAHAGTEDSTASLDRTSSDDRHPPDPSPSAAETQTRHHEPLWPTGPKYRRYLIQLCVRVTLACERAARADADGASPPPRSPFEGVAGAELFREFNRACAGRPLEVLHERGLLELFPHVRGLQRAGEEHLPIPPVLRSPGWSHFSTAAAKMQRLLSAARALREALADPDARDGHKYAAHQTAMVYNCLNHAGGEAWGLRARVEERFDEVKKFCDEMFGADSNRARDAGGAQKLPPDLAKWALGVAEEVEACVLGLPPKLTEGLGPVLRSC